MRRLILVFAIRTCYKCHFSCTYTAQLDPDHMDCVTKFTMSKNCLCERVRLSSNFEQSMISLCLSSHIKRTFYQTKLNGELCLHPKQITSTKVHILSLVTLLESAKGETKIDGRWPTMYRTSDLWLLSQTLSSMVYAEFQYSLTVSVCEPTENCGYKRRLYMYRVREFRTMLTFTNDGPLKRSADLAY